jgi:MFS family permease
MLTLDFKKLITARFLFVFAVEMQSVIVGWQIYELLRDPLSLGLVGLTEAAPALSLALFAGYIVDRSRPLRVYNYVLFISLLSALAVLAPQLFKASFTIHGEALALYLSSFLTGAARAFSQPSIFAIVPRLIARKDLAKSSAFMSSTMQVARIGGPAFGGIIFGFAGMTFSAVVVCVVLVLAIFTMFTIKMQIPAPAAVHGTAKRRITEELLSGVKFVFNHPILLSSMTLDMVSVLFGGVTALLPIFAKEILFVGAKGLGALRAAPAVGAAITGFVLTRVNVKPNAGKKFLWSVAGFGACILVFAWSKSFALSMIVLGLSGAFDSVSMVVRTSVVQLASPDNMRGRISAVNSIFIGSSNEIGEFESGVTAKFMGTIPAVYFGGVMCILTVIVTAFVCPSLRNLDLENMEPQ